MSTPGSYAILGSRSSNRHQTKSACSPRQCWISADPDEKAVSRIIDFVGADRFFWASDFPHPDHDDDYLDELAELLEPLPQDSRQAILWKNVSQCYGLG